MVGKSGSQSQWPLWWQFWLLAPLIFWQQIQTRICDDEIISGISVWRQLLAGRFKEPAGSSQLTTTNWDGQLWSLWQDMSQKGSGKNNVSSVSLFWGMWLLRHQTHTLLGDWIAVATASSFPAAQADMLQQERWVAQLFVQCDAISNELFATLCVSVSVSQSLSIFCHHILAQTNSQYFVLCNVWCIKSHVTMSVNVTLWSCVMKGVKANWHHLTDNTYNHIQSPPNWLLTELLAN